MIIEIDQSGKVEDTSKPTAVAFANGIKKSVLMKGKDKRALEKLFRKNSKRRVFIYRVFALMIFSLIKDHLKSIDTLVIDTEYPGQESLIKNYLLSEVRKQYPSFSSRDIVFKQIGKSSPAHDLAYKTFKGLKNPDRILRVDDIKSLLNW